MNLDGARRNSWSGVCLLLGSGLLWSCGASEAQLRKRAAFDFNCTEAEVEVFELDARTSGVRACGQQGTYVESCTDKGGCTWVLNSESSPAPERPEAAPAAAPAADEAPAAPPADVVAPPGGVARAVPVLGGAELRLAGRPSKSGSQVVLQLGLLGNAPENVGTWEACTESLAVADDKSFVITKTKIAKQGFSSAAVLTGVLRVGELIHVAKAQSDSAIVVCGQRNVIEPSGRRVLLRFLQDFKRVALHSGTWDPSLPGDATTSADAATSSEVPASPPAAE